MARNYEQPIGRITVAATRGVEATLGQFGGAVENVLAVSRIAPERLVDDGGYLTLREYAALLEAAANEARNSAFGLVFGSGFDTRHLGPVGYMLSLSRDVGEALTFFSRNFCCVQDATEMRLEVSGGEARLIYHVQEEDSYIRMQDAEATLGMLHSFLRRAAGAPVCTRAGFEHRANGDADFKARYLGVRPEYGSARNALHFPAELLGRKLPDHDPWLLELVRTELVSSLRRQGGARGFAEEMRGLIRREVGAGRRPDLAELAAEFGLSARTAQNRLGCLDLSFRGLCAEVTMEVARDLILKTDAPLTDIAFQLGYAESSVLSRAFRNRYGVSPRQFRKTARPAAEPAIVCMGRGCARPPFAAHPPLGAGPAALGGV